MVKRTIKLPLKIISVETLGVKSLDKVTLAKAQTTLAHLDHQDVLRKELQKEKNGLEAYIYETRDKLENGIYIYININKEEKLETNFMIQRKLLKPPQRLRERT